MENHFKIPKQKQDPPGHQHKMDPQPQTEKSSAGSGKLQDKTAIITGADSGIGRAIAVGFAKEGADVCVVYLSENEDAEETKKLVEEKGRRCLLIAGDVGQKDFCKEIIENTLKEFGKVDILVNNAGQQYPQEKIDDITEEQLEKTFRTNVFSFFFMAQAVIPHLKDGGVIINTASVTAYKGSEELLDYSASKGAVVAFTRSLSQNLAEKKIRVNAVAPGPIWTPLIVSTFDEDKIQEFGKDTPMKRPGQPSEVAPCYVFLASDDASYITGQVLHPNGGTVVNS